MIFTVSYVAWRFKQRLQHRVRYRQFFTHYNDRQMNAIFDVSNRRRSEWLFNSLCMPTLKWASNLCTIGLLGAKSIGGQWIPSQRVNNAENVSMPWRILWSLTEDTLQCWLDSCIHAAQGWLTLGTTPPLKVSVQNSQAGQHDESRHNFKVVYIHQIGHYVSLLSVSLLNWF